MEEQKQETLSEEQVRELLKQADQLRADGKYEEEVSKIRMVAENGGEYSRIGQFNLGVKYYQGQGVEQSYEDAVKWYGMAAEQGLAEAEYALGDMYFHGTGVVKDNEMALEWYEKAADHGHPRAFNACMVVREAILRDTIAENRSDNQEGDETSTPQHDFGQPFFRTQEMGVRFAAILGGYMLIGEVLRDVRLSSALMRKRKKGTICRVNMVDAKGDACTAEMIGYARQTDDDVVHRDEVQHYAAGDEVIFIVRGVWYSSDEPVEPVELFEPDDGEVATKREGFFRKLFNRILKKQN